MNFHYSILATLISFIGFGGFINQSSPEEAISNRLDCNNNTPISSLNCSEDNFKNMGLNISNDNCELIFDGFDEKLNKYRKATQLAYFFSYTHPKIKKQLQNKNFIECTGALEKIKNNYYLKLRLSLASKDASRNYGQIERNSLIRFQFINGEKLYLSNIFPDAGTIEKYTGNTVYRAIFPIDKDYLKTFRKIELDNIGIVWTTGYEQYEIYEVDFMIEKLKCIERE